MEHMISNIDIVNDSQTSSAIPDAVLSKGEITEPSVDSLLLELEEQQSRLRDPEGEALKKVNAKKVSGFIQHEVQLQSWSENSYSLFNSVVSNFGNHITTATTAISQKSEEVGLSVEKILQSACSKLGDAAVGAQKSASELSHDVFSVNGPAIKDTSKKFFQMMQRTWSRSIFNSNLTYVIHLEERERTRRINSDEEAVVIYNALRVAELIKGAALENDNQFRTPTGLYTFKLLEERERAARIKEAKLHGLRKSRVVGLINNHFQKRHMPIELKPVYEKEEVLANGASTKVLLPQSMQIFEEIRETSEAPSIESKPVEEESVARAFVAAM